jgi:hypothetical protein
MYLMHKAIVCLCLCVHLVYLNDEHGKKAFHLAQRSISMLCAGNTREFKPRMALSVFPKVSSLVSCSRNCLHAIR